MKITISDIIANVYINYSSLRGKHVNFVCFVAISLSKILIGYIFMIGGNYTITIQTFLFIIVSIVAYIIF